MNRLGELESDSIFIIRQAFSGVQTPGYAVVARERLKRTIVARPQGVFGHVPLPVTLLDTGNELDEIYAFRDCYVRGSIISTPSAPGRRDRSLATADVERRGAQDARPQASDRAARSSRFCSVSAATSRPCEPKNGFSARATPAGTAPPAPKFWDQFKTDLPDGAHIRIHPLLAWTELNIWRYIEQEAIPLVPLNFAEGGKRYRSLGEKDITVPIASTESTIAEIIVELEQTREPERAGRGMVHEREDAF